MGHIFPRPQAEIGAPARRLTTSCVRFSVASFVFTVEPGDEGVLIARAERRCTIVVFLGDARVAVIEKRAGEMRMVAAMDGGGRGAGGPEQMGGDVHAHR